MKSVLKRIIIGVLLLAIFLGLNNIVAVFAPKEMAVKKINFEDYQNIGRAYTYTNELEISDQNLWETITCSGWAFVETNEPVTDKKGHLILKGTKNSYITSDLTFSFSTIDSVLGGWKKIGSTNNGYVVKFSTVSLPSDYYEIYVYIEENENAIGIVDSGIGFKKNGVHMESYTYIEPCDVPELSEMSTEFDYGWWDIYPEETRLRIQGWQINKDVPSENLTYYIVFTGDNGEVASFKMPSINHTSLAADYGMDYVRSGFRGCMEYDQLPDTSGTRCIAAEYNGNWYRTDETIYEISEIQP